VSAAWARVCRVDELEPGKPLGRIVGDSGQDRDRVCVIATGHDGFLAMLDRCPHRDVALSRGTVVDGTLTCPGHFWRFDLQTGARTDAPERAATLYPTRVVDGWVEALLPPAQPPQSMRAWLLEQARQPR